MFLPNIHIEKLVFGGQGLGYTPDGKVILVWNALPGEIVDVETTKHKKTYIEGIAVAIKKPAEFRINPHEEHFLSSSPWQIMTYEKELEWKQRIAQETLQTIHPNLTDHPDLPVISHNPDEIFGYRNKIEYSFSQDEHGEISFAFFRRGKKQKLPITDSALAHPWLNETAHSILDWLKTTNLSSRDLKSLIIRSNLAGETLAGLFIKTPNLPNLPALPNTQNLKGFSIFYSTHKSPASVPTELRHSIGEDFLKESLQIKSSSKPVRLKYGLFSFFQVNIPVFQEALNDISRFIDSNRPIIDYYSGVGAIGLSLAHVFQSGTLVDSEPQAIQFASENIADNQITNCQAFCSPAEKMTELITSEHIVIFDPPRAGLHSNVIKQVLLERPPRLIYLSCNISTQARDIHLLSEYYQPSFFHLYNFFPRTPHIESLIVLERK